ncbi:MAG: hypothetical protein EOO17_03360 [Chloroflexi bacterium]|nr:MAG: hypothetical protein EOO17_03360 [Chloroflexota bacterium]
MNENYFRVAPGSPTTIFLAFNQNGNFVNAGSYNNNVDVYQLDTLIGQYNVTFSPDYTGSKYPTGTNPDPEPTPTCGPFDVLCWFSSAIGKVVDGFQSLGDLITGLFTSITDFIVNLFMPQNSNGEYTNIVTSGFNTIISTFRERLGFLLYPFDFLLMVNSSVIQGPNVGEVNCESSLGGKLMIPNLLGEEDVRFNVCTIENTPLWQPMTVIIRTAFILAIIFMMYSKYNSITRDREEI